MKTTLLIAPVLTLAVAAVAQTTAHPATHTTAHPANHAAAACATLPEISPKVPTIPSGSTCAKPLYTLTTEPSVKLYDLAMPASETDIRKTLGIEPVTFSLLYIDTKQGAGEIAKPGYWYTINYTGYLTDGTKFDSSEGKDPITIHYGEHMVIPGWDTGFGGMHVGGKRRLIIPYQLAYGANGKPPVIPRSATLIFDVELISQSATEPKKPEPKPTATPAPAKPVTPGSSPLPPSNPATSSPPPAATPAAAPAATPKKP